MTKSATAPTVDQRIRELERAESACLEYGLTGPAGLIREHIERLEATLPSSAAHGAGMAVLLAACF
jgi:hypothetical protein